MRQFLSEYFVTQTRRTPPGGALHLYIQSLEDGKSIYLDVDEAIQLHGCIETFIGERNAEKK